MKNYRTSIFVVLSLVILLNGHSSFVARATAESKVHIVYLGERQHDDPEFVRESHHQMLWSLLGSKEDAHDSMVYSYRHGFSGFAAKLTDSQAKKIAVVHVTPDSFYELATSRTWDYLGLSAAYSENILNDTNMGEEEYGQNLKSLVIMGLDRCQNTGKEAVNQERCSTHLTATKKKLIGAKYFINAFLAENEEFNSTESLDFISPRDFDGHGTHVATIAGGSVLPSISYKGLAGGTVRGGAPRARIEMYKTCWYLDDYDITTCSSADLLKAMDEAIHDGVDVLSLSIGNQVPYYPETDIRNGIATGAFHAVLKGITVVSSGVAATTLDRSFPTPITLGSNKVILSQAMYTGQELGFTSLVYPENRGNSNKSFSGTCESLLINSNLTMAGKVVLCFTTIKRHSAVSSAARYVKRAGGLGVIVARNPGDALSPCVGDFPCVAVDYELGTNILLYIRSSGTLVGQPVATKVADFSSRGPNSLSPAIFKLIDENKWNHFNDAHVSSVNESEIKNSAAYLLFYRRVGSETETESAEMSRTDMD
ncbi:unnamed protein product [Thlaspi arvense]|uniref:Uncharacterized protein n=1 Tax=Thlaspi arvense TaxID=13288 RepID=A0AAU9SUS7_THLAR|nr:unnamed protein product [Thlaspi arvense]